MKKIYIVFESSLLELFQSCPMCKGPSDGFVSETKGTRIKVTQRCQDSNCNHQNYWTNQQYVRTMPVGNLLMSAAILISGMGISAMHVHLIIHIEHIYDILLPFSGLSTEKVLRMFKFMNIACISRAAYYRHASKYVNPVIIQEWRNKQDSLFMQFKDQEQGLVLAGDGRCDSPGHCAKYGSYTVIEQTMNRVLDFQLVQVCIQNLNYSVQIIIYIAQK